MSRVDAIDLAHSDADRGAVVGEKDRVGLDGPTCTPSEFEVLQRLFISRLAGCKGPVGRVVTVGVDRVALLQERTAGNRLQLDTLR